MQHYWSLGNLQLNKTWLTIGSFDGVHRGHQQIIRELVSGAHAHGANAIVLTFYPHPAVVLGKRQGFQYLTTPEERARQFRKLGVDYLITHPFNTQIAHLSALDFVSTIHEHLDFTRLCVGYDFALGRNREGDVARLKELGGEFGFRLNAILPFKVEGEIVSSSKIRAYLREGVVEQAANLLGRNYLIRGEVVPGDGRGKKIGVPTANLDVWEDQVVPAGGVYVCKARLGADVYGAVINIGIRPTFESQDERITVEAHLLGLDRDVYGQGLELEFITRLRDEIRFSNVQTLIDQIHRDINKAKKVLSENIISGFSWSNPT
jgi:riboflavin kinase/FMN adenylyltransferase